MPDFVGYGLDWCKTEELPPKRCVLLVSKRLQMATSDIEEAITRCMYKPVEVKEIFRREEEDPFGWIKTLILVRTGVDVEDVALPIQVQVDCGDKAIDFQVFKLRGTVEPTKETSASTKESTATDDLVRTLAGLSNHYKKFNSFAGLKEDDFDAWTSQVKGQLYEWGNAVSEKEKRRRIREALSPPAAEVVDDLKRERPDATSEDYLDALELAYGSIESGEELYVKYCNMCQGDGEQPSNFLTRLQQTLRKVIAKGGASERKSNHLLLNQFIRGLVFDHMMVIDLNLQARRDDPPAYIFLLGLVRRQEEEQGSRERKAKLARAQGRSATSNIVGASPSSSEESSIDTDVLSRITRLEKLFLARNEAAVRIQEAVPSKPTTEERGNSQRSREDRPKFCYKCGEDGHMQKRCQKKADPELVNRRFIQYLHMHKTQGKGRWHQTRGDQVPKQH